MSLYYSPSPDPEHSGHFLTVAGDPIVLDFMEREERAQDIPVQKLLDFASRARDGWDVRWYNSDIDTILGTDGGTHPEWLVLMLYELQKIEVGERIIVEMSHRTQGDRSLFYKIPTIHAGLRRYRTVASENKEVKAFDVLAAHLFELIYRGFGDDMHDEWYGRCEAEWVLKQMMMLRASK